jgi:hypothetical protein
VTSQLCRSVDKTLNLTTVARLHRIVGNTPRVNVSALSQFLIIGAEKGVPEVKSGVGVLRQDGGVAQSVLDLKFDAF